MKAKRKTNGATKVPAFVASTERASIRVARALREETLQIAPGVVFPNGKARHEMSGKRTDTRTQPVKICTLTPIQFPLAMGYALPPRKRAPWLAASDGLDVFGLADTTAGRRRMVERLERRALEEGNSRAGVVAVSGEVDARCSHLRRGWYWGSQNFAEKLLKLAGKTLGRTKSRAYRGVAIRRAHGLERAEQWLREGLAAAGLDEKELAAIPGSDPRKIVLARLLWRGTTVSQVWLAERLAMRTAANVSQQLRRLGGKRLKRKIPRGLALFVERALRQD